MNPVKALQEYGQSVWLDYIQRHLIASGELQRLIAEDGLRGMTSNPAIFEKAITGSTDYAAALKALSGRDLDAMGLYEQLAIHDIQDAADIMRQVYEATRRGDGYISLEVSPHLAHDTPGTIREARRLWQTVGRPNVMIKVPGTPAGLPAIEQLLSEGINVNVTLLFSQEVYERVAATYITGLERLAGQGGDVSQVASVASFFISRIDTAIDAQVTAGLKSAQTAQERTLLRSLLGKVAIANGKLTYQRFKAIFQGARWEELAAKGARKQRVLWASTSTKNPNYRDVMYVEELIGPDTVNTMPPATLEDFRDHGRPRASLEEDLQSAHDTMEILAQVGISMQAVTAKLLDDGVRLFAEPFDKLLDALAPRAANSSSGN
jgi:transaldolase / glucose-6-phosphate isomerase